MMREQSQSNVNVMLHRLLGITDRLFCKLNISAMLALSFWRGWLHTSLYAPHVRGSDVWANVVWLQPASDPHQLGFHQQGLA